MGSAGYRLEDLQGMAEICLGLFGEKLKVRVVVREHHFFEADALLPAFYKHPNIWVRPDFVQRASFTDIVKLLRQMLKLAVAVARFRTRVPYWLDERVLKGVRGVRLRCRNGRAAYRVARRRFNRLRANLRDEANFFGLRETLLRQARNLRFRPLSVLEDDELGNAFGPYFVYTGRIWYRPGYAQA